MHITIQEARNGYVITMMPEPWDVKAGGAAGVGPVLRFHEPLQPETYVASDAEETLGIVRHLLDLKSVWSIHAEAP